MGVAGMGGDLATPPPGPGSVPLGSGLTLLPAARPGQGLNEGLISMFGVYLWLSEHNKGLTWSLSNWLMKEGRENRFVMHETFSNRNSGTRAPVSFPSKPMYISSFNPLFAGNELL